METALLFSPSGWQPISGIPLSDRGFRYGMHFFETLFSRQNHWEFWDEHVDTLRFYGESAGFLTFPDAWPLLAQNPPPLIAASARARLFWSAGPGQPASPPAQGSILASLEPIPPSPKPPPLNVMTHPHPLPDHPFPGKSGNYWARLHALQQARNLGYDEALLFNSQGHWLGLCCGNGYAKIGPRFLTPALSTGARRGVIRQQILKSLPIEEALLTRADLTQATALAFSSSHHGLLPVADFDRRPLDLSPWLE